MFWQVNFDTLEKKLFMSIERPNKNFYTGILKFLIFGIRLIYLGGGGGGGGGAFKI